MLNFDILNLYAKDKISLSDHSVGWWAVNIEPATYNARRYQSMKSMID